ncbi:hypothetical protein Tco_0037765 [Tanacetum coccineum]
MVDLTGDEDPTDEDGDIGMGDSTGVLMSLGGEIASGGNKSQESNIGDSDSTGDGDTTVGKRGRYTKIPQSGGPHIKVGDEAVHKELGDGMERAATTASSFEAEQDSGNTN